MEYTKPTVTRIAKALSAIQGNKIGGFDDSLHAGQQPYSTAAYEADE